MSYAFLHVCRELWHCGAMATTQVPWHLRYPKWKATSYEHGACAFLCWAARPAGWCCARRKGVTPFLSCVPVDLSQRSTETFVSMIPSLHFFFGGVTSFSYSIFLPFFSKISVLLSLQLAPLKDGDQYVIAAFIHWPLRPTHTHHAISIDMPSCFRRFKLFLCSGQTTLNLRLPLPQWPPQQRKSTVSVLGTSIVYRRVVAQCCI